MRLPLLMLLFAAMFAWTSFELDRLEAAPSSMARETRGSPLPSATIAEPTIRPRVSDAVPGAGAPLFRPATMPAELAAPQPGDALLLIGLAGDGERRVAFLRDTADAETFTAREGEEVRGWRLEQVQERCVALRKAARRESVCLQ